MGRKETILKSMEQIWNIKANTQFSNKSIAKENVDVRLEPGVPEAQSQQRTIWYYSESNTYHRSHTPLEHFP